MGKKKDKDAKERRKEALKALFKSDYFVQKIAILMKMENYPKDEIKSAFKKAMKKQSEQTELDLTAWSSNGKKKSKNIDEETAWHSTTKLDNRNKHKVVRRDRNRETVNIISSILG